MDQQTVHRAPAPRSSGRSSSGRGSSARTLAQIAVFAAVIAAFGMIPGIPLGGPVAVVLQTLGVLLAGAVLGPLRGAASVTLFLGLVALGLPLLSGFRGGLGVFAGPTVGFLVSWVLTAFVVGLIVHGGLRRRDVLPTWPRTLLATVVAGMVTMYAVGVPVMALILGLGAREAMITTLTFVPGDLIKGVLAAVITMQLWKAYPRAFRA